jgi:ecotin
MFKQLLPLIVLLVLCSMATADEAERYLKAFPPADEGQTRFVILLPPKERGEDGNFQVEIIVGKEMLTDGINQVRLGGKIESKPLQGWGFTYYQVDKFGPVASTLIGVPPGTPMVMKFVTVPSLIIPYNSRIPLVVYVPEGSEVRYRIWKAGEMTEKAKEG